MGEHARSPVVLLVDQVSMERLAEIGCTGTGECEKATGIIVPGRSGLAAGSRRLLGN